jgi:hypothetical protein
LLVALNVVLDLLMGCTSSVVRSEQGTCYHLRTLDWAMDPLRRVVVQLDYIRSNEDPDRVLASSITYVGFVGVLTGVRPHLSMSLNFRAVHHVDGRWTKFRFYAHHLAVLLGLSRSISSILREYLLTKQVPLLASLERDLPSRRTTAAYLTFSDGAHALVLEKDYNTAIARHDIDGFVVATNHDFANPALDKELTPGATSAVGLTRMCALDDFMDDSEERAACVSAKWRRHRRAGGSGITGRLAAAWTSDWPTANETTHYACVLDPDEGQVEWARVYVRPLREPHHRL